MERILVIGHGYAGQRFMTALSYLRMKGLPIEIVGVVDHAPDKLPQNVQGFTDLRTALDTVRPSVVCVTVNEVAHIEVFRELAERERMLVLCEKPLVADPPDERLAEAMLNHHQFSMNLVE